MIIPPHPEVEEIDRIAAITNPVIRNLWITDSYCKLSTVISKRTGPIANWCTFATWASKQAGQTIRGEDFKRTVETALCDDPVIERSIAIIAGLAKQLGNAHTQQHIQNSVVGILIHSTIKQTSEAVARGNKKVFEEIAREFSRFINACMGDDAYNIATINNFCTQLKDGDPPGGQAYLKSAFRRYYESLFESDLKKRTELCFLANLEIGFHEQNRLQPEIAESLDAPSANLHSLPASLFDILFPKKSILGKVLSVFRNFTPKTNLLNKELQLLMAKVQEHLRKIITAELMTLTLPPGNRLHLGRDLVATYPVNLQQLQNLELVALLARIDTTQNSLKESGATDWANLQERLHYITDLFRCYHEKTELFSEAFSIEQLTFLNEGKLPAGAL